VNNRTTLEVQQAIVELLGFIGGVKSVLPVSLPLVSIVATSKAQGVVIYVRASRRPLEAPSAGSDPSWTKTFMFQIVLLVPVRGDIGIESTTGAESAQNIADIIESRIINRKILRGDGKPLMTPLKITEIAEARLDFNNSYVVQEFDLQTSTTFFRRYNVTHSAGPSFPSDPSAGDKHYLTDDGVTYTYGYDDQWLSEEADVVHFVQAGALVSGNPVPNALGTMIGFGGRSMVVTRIEVNMPASAPNDGFDVQLFDDATLIDTVTVPAGSNITSVSCNVPLGVITAGGAGLVLKTTNYLGDPPEDIDLSIEARKLGA
jgi:hypothetical protein